VATKAAAIIAQSAFDINPPATYNASSLTIYRIRGERTCMSKFASRVLAWYEQHGRKTLPWQKDISPYRVWVSEIMLQQTQVSTVIPYFNVFIDCFPTVEKLALASEDEVLHLWSGLGYYSRARNLHKTAKIVVAEYNARFPDDLETLQKLPGIGRSTAGAILATAFEIPTPILDGNVKRVLARHEGIAGWPGKSSVARILWDASCRYTPARNSRPYTQAIMDLGATLCTRNKPDCPRCPVSQSCVALKENNIEQYPGKKSRKTLPVKSSEMMILVNDQDQVLLEKRPGTGVWGGLWCLPELTRMTAQVKACKKETWPALRHTFSHFHLDITPVVIHGELRSQVMDNTQLLWYNVYEPQQLGLAAPVSRLLDQLKMSFATRSGLPAAKPL